jgi:hypothetical protein
MMRPSLQPVDQGEPEPTLREVLERVDALAARIAAIGAQVDEIRAARRPRQRPLEPGAEALVQAIAEHVGKLLFAARDLVNHAQLRAGSGLCEAILAVCGALSGRRLGKFLRRVEGREIGGQKIVRVGADRDGATWRVLRL